MKFLLSIVLWNVPLLVLVLLSGRAKPLVIRILLRCAYIPIFFFVLLGLYVLWGADGATNLIAVPAVFATTLVLLKCFILKSWKERLSYWDAMALYISSSVLITFLVIALIYLALPISLEIS